MNKSKHMTNCPSCSSNRISYDIKSETLKCEHCNQKIETKKVEKKIKEIDTLKGIVINETNKSVPKLQKELFAIKCTKCGAIKYTKDKTKYTYCRLCGNKEHEVLKNTEEPKYILPFLLNREEVYAKHKSAVKDKKQFSNQKFIDNFKRENLIGIYVPYRIENDKYTCDMHGTGHATYAIYHSDDGTSYKTIKYRINRNLEVDAKDIYYERIDFEIETRKDMLDNIITEVSPYDMKEKIELKKEYLEEYIVLKANEIPIIACTQSAKLSNIAKYAVRDDVLKYDYGIIWDTIECNVLKSDVSYVYLPIWLYYTAKTNKKRTEYYYVAINGRTNEIGMHLPFDKKKALLYSSIKALLALFVTFGLFVGFLLVFVSTASEDIRIFTYCVILGIMAIIYLVIFVENYFSIKLNYEKNNNYYENDDLIDYTSKILHRAERKIGKDYSTWTELRGRNDNFKKYR